MNTENNTIIIIEQACRIAHSPDVEELPRAVLSLLKAIIMPDAVLTDLTLEQAITTLQQAADKIIGDSF